MKILIISIPLLSAFSMLSLGRFIGIKGGEYISKSSIIGSMGLSIISLIENIKGEIKTINIKEWFKLPTGMEGQIELIFDKETIIMINLISIITLAVIFYSYWYLGKDAHINRFISLLLIFSTTMYILVVSKNFLFSFFGWEGVGIISFLLINFWSNSIQNSKSALKAVIFNKIGDIFFILAMIILSIEINNLDYSFINNSISFSNGKNFISIFLILAAMAKSAQLFFQCWLGDAMAGPTPVSALLHAATMVTAGIFIILRSKIIIFNSSSYILNFILIIGSLTILFAGLTSLYQYDIKKIIAFSTCGQIGYMFFALGLFKPVDISIFHLVTHGFFKALLFLSAGLLIHSYLYEQDLRKYSNFLFKSPLFYIFFLIGSLAIIAFPPLSGFYSKDLILLHSLNSSASSPYFFFFLLFLGSLLSSLYSFKILFYSFFNTSFSPSIYKFHLLASPQTQLSSELVKNNGVLLWFKNKVFLYPFLFLILGSIFLGFFSINFFASPESLNLSLEKTINNSFLIKFLPFSLPFIAFLFFSFSFLRFNIKFNSFLPIASRKFFFDNFYNYFFIKFFYSLSYHFSFKFLDRGFLEFLAPVSFFRLFFYFPSNFGLIKQSYNNLFFLFFYFFSSLTLLFFSFYFFSPNFIFNLLPW